MNNSNTQIDIRDIFLRLLSQWKAVMIVSLLCALFMAGFKYHKDVTNYNAAVAESAKQSSKNSKWVYRTSFWEEVVTNVE